MFWPSWICTQTFVDLHTNLRGFAHKPSWICTQTFVDLHTNLRGFAHKPASRGQGSGFSLASKGQGSGFSPVFHVFHRLFSFFVGVGAPGFRFFTVFLLEGPGFRIFTGLSKGQGSGFSLVFQVFHWLFSFFTGVGVPSGFSLFLFSRAPGARVQVFHSSRGQGSVFHWLRRPSKDLRPQGSGFSLFFFTASRGQGSGFHWRRGARVQVFHWLRRPNKTGRRGPRVQVFHWFFFHGEEPGFRFFTRRGARVRFFTGFGDLVRT